MLKKKRTVRTAVEPPGYSHCEASQLRTTNSRHASTSSDREKPCLNIAPFSKMDERMKQAAESGDINAMHQLIEEHVNLLDHIDQVPSVQTPLHIAASAGHILFATSMMILKPSFTRKLNPNGLSPIYLALQNGHIELVHQLLHIDGDLVRVKGNECITPLHYVVATGDQHIDLLDKFLLVCPDSITDMTVRDETALHIALKNDQLKAFRFLVGWLGSNFFENTSLNKDLILNQKDDEGNTVLHIAVSKNQTQVVSQLLTWCFRFNVNSTNLENKTAWDISQGQTQVDNREIRLMLHSAGASSGSSLSTLTQSDDNNIEEFYTLIREDVKLLEHIDELPFVDTPLHIAASAGHIQFATEMMGLKPSFASKLNPYGFSPIHLALQNGHIELVRRFLQFDGDLVRVKGRERITALHYVVAKHGNLDLLKEFLLVCPDSIADVTVRNETALHIALIYDNFRAFKFLVGWLERNWSKNASFYERVILNQKDNLGNTILHIAVLKDQIEAVRLLTCGFRLVRLNHRNLEGQTALDISRSRTQLYSEEIRDLIIGHGRAQSGSRLSIFNWFAKYLIPPLSSFLKFLRKRFARERMALSDERRNVLLVVAVLLVTISYQGVLSPPGGLWQDDQTLSNTTTAHKAGTAIGLKRTPFVFFLVFNTCKFVFSNSIIVLLIPDGYLGFFTINVFLLWSCYFCALLTITQAPNWTISLVFLSALIFLFLVGTTFRKYKR